MEFVAATHGTVRGVASIGADTVAVGRVEIVTRGERRRSYSPEEKARLLAEMAEPGARVLEVA